MNKRINDLMTYLDASRSVFHAVEGLKNILEKAGYTRLQESSKWELAAGGKYYLTRGGASIMAFRIPEVTPKGFMMSASHADRPTFKVKENGELVGKYTRLAVERYGGMLMGTWLDRPLSIAGRVMVETQQGVQSRLLDIDRDLLLIPNVAIHMNRKANEGYAWNPAVDTLPLVGGQGAAEKLWELLEAEAGGKILGHDLYLYIRQRASVWGVAEEYISTQALDDLACAWSCTRGFVEAGENSAINVLCLFDSEEVGSATTCGAGSTLLQTVLERVCRSLGADLQKLLTNSFMVSADNAHAMHPNHPEYADPANAPVLGGGVVLKFNAAQKYTTCGITAAVWRKICQKANVPVQTYCNRADIPGGSTLGCVSLTHVSVPSVDVGIAQLAMHSCYETVAAADVAQLEKAMQTYYSTSLSKDGNGSVDVR